MGKFRSFWKVDNKIFESSISLIPCNYSCDRPYWYGFYVQTCSDSGIFDVL
jgi:hypothetical protein